MTRTAVLGEGVLGWHSAERHTERYGAVHLNTKTAADPAYIDFADAPVGRVGALVALVLEIQLDIGAIEVPTVGEEIRLGYGELFTEDMNPALRVLGVRPADRFRKPWLIRDALIACRGQWVRLELRS